MLNWRVVSLWVEYVGSNKLARFYLCQLVQSLSRARGRSVVVVLHDLNMAARYCDHIVALKSGRLVFEGAPDDLMTPDRLHDIYGARMEVMTRADGSPVALPV